MADKRKAAELKAKRKHENPPSLEEWLAKRAKKLDKSESPSEVKVSAPMLPQYQLPVYLQGISNLPPSVIPPVSDCLIDSNIQGWG